MERNPGIASNAAETRFRTTVTTCIALACVVASCVVFIRRGQAAAEAAAIAPGVAVTSGFEEESFFALWRVVHGEPIYSDATRIPFAATYFNWLFYRCYASPLVIVSPRLGDASIPQTGRLTTAVITLIGTAVLSGLLRHILGGHTIIAVGLATLLFFGPLVGWWAHTLRPDVGALALEAIALATLLVQYRTRPTLTIIVSVLLFYGAWSFKQTYVIGLGSALLFLAYRRQWRVATGVAAGSVILWTLTFVLLGPEYRTAFQGAATNSAYYLSLGVANFRDMAMKTFPLWLLAASSLPLLRSSAPEEFSPFTADARLLGWLGIFIAVPFTFAASCKLGASSYYFFTMTAMLTLLAASGLSRRPTSRLVTAGFGLGLILQVLVLTGHAGRISLDAQSRELAVTWASWQHEPEPRFSHQTSFNLPWLSPASPPLILAFNYASDRAKGGLFESNGVGGLIASGYFRSLLLPAETKTSYDGGSLRLYARGNTVNGFTVFRRLPSLPQ